jgi:predicted AAA+ superfamily ATPase
MAAVRQRPVKFIDKYGDPGNLVVLPPNSMKIGGELPVYGRYLQLKEILARKSVFLLGPRQTGKSTYLRQQFPDARYVDLLEADTFRELSSYPETLRQRLLPSEKLVIIDEIQKLPSLLDEVQLLIDRNKDLRFILTGSSARKLRRGAANLLGGRSYFLHFHPLVSPELGGGGARIADRCNFGSLPAIIDSPMAKRELDNYVGIYLREEIQAEALTRSIENFARVLNFSAHLNTEQVNYTKVGNDAGVPPRTVRDYFQIFQDTLVAHLLPPFQKTSKRKAVATEKFYFFDTGVARSLARSGDVSPATPAFGKALEHLIFLELVAYRDYTLSDISIQYWRSQSQFEVDFVVNESLAIEVKASSRVSSRDLKGLKALHEDTPMRRRIVISGENARRTVDGVEVIHFDDFLTDLWSHRIVKD